MRVVLFILLAIALGDILTTNEGNPIDNGHNSETIGNRGPILLEDYYLIEKLQIHNRERIPERNVHARGALAKGTFTVTNDVTDFTVADFLSEVGKETQIACRWSTVIHSRGSPEFLRDPRGFALKFYTDEGNYDIVGLNFPVFFIRDGIQFPEMIRSLKPNPVSGVQEWWRIWDYFSHYPESVHMFTWLLDDVGIPLSYRHMNGWGVHTYKWINQNSDTKLIRYFWESSQGEASLDDAEAVKIDFSNHTYDMYTAINEGNYPSWTLYVQMMDENITDFLDFDPLDTTVQWPVDQFPYVEVGVLEFTQNAHQFLENEQSAFSPASFVPGILPSAEKMLQTRMFAYADTQKYRLGVNYEMLPINKPKCPYFDGHVDGQMNFVEVDFLEDFEVDYFPSVNTDVKEAAPYPHDPEILYGARTRASIDNFDNFKQPSIRYNSFDADRQERFARRVGQTLSDPRMNEDVLKTWMAYWTEVDAGLASMIQNHITN